MEESLGGGDDLDGGHAEQGRRVGSGPVARVVLPVVAAVLAGAVFIPVVTGVEWLIGRPLMQGTASGVLLAVLGVGVCLATGKLVSRRGARRSQPTAQ
jgi:hypothetical protein